MKDGNAITNNNKIIKSISKNTSFILNTLRRPAKIAFTQLTFESKISVPPPPRLQNLNITLLKNGFLLFSARVRKKNSGGPHYRHSPAGVQLDVTALEPKLVPTGIVVGIKIPSAC
jgi:hypothetical protein